MIVYTLLMVHNYLLGFPYEKQSCLCTLQYMCLVHYVNVLLHIKTRPEKTYSDDRICLEWRQGYENEFGGNIWDSELYFL